MATAPAIDTVYIAASTRDARYTRICVASVRRFYPDVRVDLLAGGALEPGLIEELREHWNVGVAELPGGDYGWGFVKLEPLFGPAGQRFLMLDSDTVMAGPVLDLFRPGGAPFLVDEESQPEADIKRLYYDWEKVRQVDPDARRPAFVFNSGQWFGTSGILAREDFSPWVAWDFPRQLRHPAIFMPGDQGVLNYVLNQKHHLQGLPVDRQVIMRWPGASMEGLEAQRVAAGVAPPLVVHWAGVKKPRFGQMSGADLLAFFERKYYARLPAGAVRRLRARINHFAGHYLRRLKARMAKP